MGVRMPSYPPGHPWHGKEHLIIYPDNGKPRMPSRLDNLITDVMGVIVLGPILIVVAVFILTAIDFLWRIMPT